MKQNKQLMVLLAVVLGIAFFSYLIFNKDIMPAQSALPTQALAPAAIWLDGGAPPPSTSLWIERDPGSFVQNPQCTQAGGNLRCNPAMHNMLNGQAVTAPILHSGALTYHMDFTVRMAGTENVFSAPDDESSVVGIAFEDNDVSMVGFVYDQEYDYWGIRKNDGYVKLCSAEGEVALSDWVCPWDEVVSE